MGLTEYRTAICEQLKSRYKEVFGEIVACFENGLSSIQDIITRFEEAHGALTKKRTRHVIENVGLHKHELLDLNNLQQMIALVCALSFAFSIDPVSDEDVPLVREVILETIK